jgi:hypothetical protein
MKKIRNLDWASAVTTVNARLASFDNDNNQNPAQQASQPAPASSQSAPPSSPAPAPSSLPPPPPATPAGVAGGLGAAQASPPSTPPEVSVRDFLAQTGLDLRGQFQDDSAALTYLAQQAQQAAQLQQQMRQIQPYAQEYMQHAAQFQQWLAQQQQAQAQQRQQQQSWWRAPEYDPAWEHQILRDQAGNLVPAPGAPHNVVQKYQEWVSHQRKFLNDFSRDPISTIGPGIEQMVRQMAGQMMQEQMARYQQDSLANDFVRQNAHWLYAQQNGQFVMNNGQPQLTPAGQRYAGYVQMMEQVAPQNVQFQHQMARMLLERDVMEARLSQLAGQMDGQGGGQQQAPGQAQQPADPALQSKEEFLRRAQSGQRAPAPAGSVAVPAQPNQHIANGMVQRGIAEEMLKQFASEGFQPSQAIA